MVVEADESDRSFLKLTPSIAVITNIDHEHMESYGSWDALQQAFVDFANKVPFYGAVVACVDDAPVRALVPRMTRRVVTYGFEGSGADDHRPRHDARGVRLALPGRAGHARMAATTELGTLAAARARAPQPAERARRGRRRPRGRRAVREDRQRLRGLPRRRAALSAARRSARRHGGRRLRPSSDGDRRRHRRRARRPRPPRGRRLPAAPLHADARSARRVRRGARRAPTRSSSPTSIRPAKRRSPARPRRRWKPWCARPAVRCTLVKALDDLPAAVARRRAPERSGDHARRRLDRHDAGSHPRGASQAGSVDEPAHARRGVH